MTAEAQQSLHTKAPELHITRLLCVSVCVCACFGFCSSKRVYALGDMSGVCFESHRGVAASSPHRTEGVLRRMQGDFLLHKHDHGTSAVSEFPPAVTHEGSIIPCISSAVLGPGSYRASTHGTFYERVSSTRYLQVLFTLRVIPWRARYVHFF